MTAIRVPDFIEDGAKVLVDGKPRQLKTYYITGSGGHYGQDEILLVFKGGKQMAYDPSRVKPQKKWPKPKKDFNGRMRKKPVIKPDDQPVKLEPPKFKFYLKP